MQLALDQDSLIQFGLPTLLLGDSVESTLYYITVHYVILYYTT